MRRCSNEIAVSLLPEESFFFQLKICRPPPPKWSSWALSHLRICRGRPSPPLRSGHLGMKEHNVLRLKMGVNFISHHIAFGRWRCPKVAFWAPKNSFFFENGQICREDWYWSNAHFSHKWFFFVKFLVFEI